MKQAKVLTEKEFKKVVDMCSLYKHAERNKAILELMYFSGIVQPPVFGPPFKLVSGDAFSAPSAVLPKVQEVDNSELNVV